MADSRQTNEINSSGDQIDSQLLKISNDNEESENSADKVGALKEVQRNLAFNDNSASEEGPTSLREAVLRNKKAQEVQQAQNKQNDSFSITGGAPMRKGTSSLLRQAWIYLVPSFGLTLIWINIHAFFNLIFGPRYFCNLGEEWIDLVSGGSVQAKEAMSKSAGKSAGTVEKMGLGCLNLGCLFLIIIVVGIIALILKVVESPLSFFAEMIGYVWDAAVNGITQWIAGD